MTQPPKLSFEVLFDDAFSAINQDATLSPINNKKVLSAINDFEDGKWRFTKFQNFIWDNIAETALSVAEREALAGQSHSLLTAAARSLRLTDASGDIGKGSELAEIVLYGLMRHHYGALPVVPKIFYKQNVQDNAKGADSVHIVIADNDFSVWFGEAKFYSDIEDARLATIITTVETSLSTDKLKKENSIITNIRDLDVLVSDVDLRNSIRDCLKPANSIDHLKPRLHIPILLLHECAITKAATAVSTEYKKAVLEYHAERARSYFQKQIAKIGSTIPQYSQITFHVILFPVPDKATIVDSFLGNVKHYKQQ